MGVCFSSSESSSSSDWLASAARGLSDTSDTGIGTGTGAVAGAVGRVVVGKGDMLGTGAEGGRAGS